MTKSEVWTEKFMSDKFALQNFHDFVINFTSECTLRQSTHSKNSTSRIGGRYCSNGIASLSELRNKKTYAYFICIFNVKKKKG